MKLSLKCKLYGDQPHTPCSGTTDDGHELPCECWCHMAGELCGSSWSAGGFEGDAPWDGLLCELPAHHDGWHETGICDPPVIGGRITWLVNRC